jgi:cytochrome P450
MTGCRAPGPRGLPLTGNLWEMGRDALGFLSGLEERFGSVAQARVGHLRYHLISDPALIEQVLWRRADRYSRKSPASDKMVAITGSSLLTTIGPAWLERRKLIAPFFSRERMLAQRPAMAALGRRHIDGWSASVHAGLAVDATASLMSITCTIASQVLFGLVVDDPALEQAMADILAHHWKRLVDPLQLAHRLPTRSKRAFARGNKIVAAIVAKVAMQPGTGMVLEALHKVGPGETGIRIADELITLLIAGHETTASALAWALHLLAEHPEQQELLRQETGAAKDIVSAPLPLAHRVFQEALRLYPSIWLIERASLSADELGGFHLPRGGNVIISPWVMHRSRRFWDEPAAFRPDRFLEPPAKHVYLPFGLGPHACVGANLAMIEGPLVLALIAQRWRWRHAPRTTVVPRPGLTLRMKQSLRLILEEA